MELRTIGRPMLVAGLGSLALADIAPIDVETRANLTNLAIAALLGGNVTCSFSQAKESLRHRDWGQLIATSIFPVFAVIHGIPLLFPSSTSVSLVETISDATMFPSIMSRLSTFLMFSSIQCFREFSLQRAEREAEEATNHLFNVLRMPIQINDGTHFFDILGIPEEELTLENIETRGNLVAEAPTENQEQALLIFHSIIERLLEQLQASDQLAEAMPSLPTRGVDPKIIFNAYTRALLLGQAFKTNKNYQTLACAAHHCLVAISAMNLSTTNYTPGAAAEEEAELRVKLQRGLEHCRLGHLVTGLYPENPFEIQIEDLLTQDHLKGPFAHYAEQAAAAANALAVDTSTDAQIDPGIKALVEKFAALSQQFSDQAPLPDSALGARVKRA